MATFIVWEEAGFSIEKNLATPGSTSAVKITSIEQLDCNIHPCRGELSGQYQIEVIVSPTKRTVPKRRYQVALRENDGPPEFRTVRWSQFEISNRTGKRQYFLVSRDGFVNEVSEFIKVNLQECPSRTVIGGNRCQPFPSRSSSFSFSMAALSILVKNVAAHLYSRHSKTLSHAGR